MQAANIPQLISDQRSEDMIVGALEGGSNYWYWIPDASADIVDRYKSNKEEPFATAFYKAIKAGESIPVHDIEDESLLGNINLQSITQGEKTMMEKHSAHYADIISEHDDAITADVWFQLAVMNDLVYG